MKLIMILVGLTLAVAAPFVRAEPDRTNGLPGSAPREGVPTSHWTFVRHDPVSLKELGGGDVVKGMNRLGEQGFELFLVTTSDDTGKAGWFYFRQSPWNLPVPRPKLEYRQMDDTEINALAPASYNDALDKIAQDGWQLIAITTTKGGGTGWTYFMREYRPSVPNTSSGPDRGTAPASPTLPPTPAPEPRTSTPAIPENAQAALKTPGA